MPDSRAHTGEKPAADLIASQLAAKRELRKKAKKQRRIQARLAKQSTTQDDSSTCQQDTALVASPASPAAATRFAGLLQTPPPSVSTPPEGTTAEHSTSERCSEPASQCLDVYESIKTEVETQAPSSDHSTPFSQQSSHSSGTQLVTDAATDRCLPESPSIQYFELMMDGMKQMSAEIRNMNERVARIEWTTQHTDRQTNKTRAQMKRVKESVRRMHSKSTKAVTAEVRKEMVAIGESVQTAEKRIVDKMDEHDEHIRKAHSNLEEKMACVSTSIQAVQGSVDAVKTVNIQMRELDERAHRVHISLECGMKAIHGAVDTKLGDLGKHIQTVHEMVGEKTKGIDDRISQARDSLFTEISDVSKSGWERVHMDAVETLGGLHQLRETTEDIDRKVQAVQERVMDKMVEVDEHVQELQRGLEDKMSGIERLHQGTEDTLNGVEKIQQGMADKMSGIEKTVEAVQKTVEVKMKALDDRVNKAHLSLEDKIGVVERQVKDIPQTVVNDCSERIQEVHSSLQDKMGGMIDCMNGMHATVNAKLDGLDKRVQTTHEMVGEKIECIDDRNIDARESLYSEIADVSKSVRTIEEKLNEVNAGVNILRQPGKGESSCPDIEMTLLTLKNGLADVDASIRVMQQTEVKKLDTYNTHLQQVHDTVDGRLNEIEGRVETTCDKTAGIATLVQTVQNNVETIQQQVGMVHDQVHIVRDQGLETQRLVCALDVRQVFAAKQVTSVCSQVAEMHGEVNWIRGHGTHLNDRIFPSMDDNFAGLQKQIGRIETRLAGPAWKNMHGIETMRWDERHPNGTVAQTLRSSEDRYQHRELAREHGIHLLAAAVQQTEAVASRRPVQRDDGDSTRVAAANEQSSRTNVDRPRTTWGVAPVATMLNGTTSDLARWREQ